jgi:hypothetical protein
VETPARLRLADPYGHYQSLAERTSLCLRMKAGHSLSVMPTQILGRSLLTWASGRCGEGDVALDVSS